MSDILPPLILQPIGLIRTPFHDRAQAPRQPRAEREVAEGQIILHTGHNFEQALADLAGFDYIWIISWFHKNKNWKPKVLPPRDSKIKRGLFATRSPHRPNPIGLSLARLIGIDGLTVRVAETDLLDGTPILDLKPYLPHAESFPGARAGWLDAARDAHAENSIEWSPLAAKQCAWLLREFNIDLRAPTERVLSRDAAPHPYRRISRTKSGALQLALKSWRIEFSVRETRVTIERIASGYSAAALNFADAGTLHDDDAHRAFHAARWNCQI
ncbi:MAG TPA: tRNA (N6-threonylcarbamoyladenosine(37)-N6)-methyltransferase TrmO [Planctomycetota bacterium]|nr:tRNA (N6-threonylcarbamoyladenosine(37)-N6)-methyltransferase TrmO [Planctomycetota bacterium]